MPDFPSDYSVNVPAPGRRSVAVVMAIVLAALSPTVALAERSGKGLLRGEWFKRQGIFEEGRLLKRQGPGEGQEKEKGLVKPGKGLLKPGGGILPDQKTDPSPNLAVTSHETVTRDGWKLAMKRYVKKAPLDGEPKAAVVLCHGFNLNNQFWDMDQSVSLARYLAEAGYDVWAPDLRGSGASSKPLASKMRELSKLEVKKIAENFAGGDASDITKLGWSIDDHIQKDIPAILDYVTAKSGFEKVYWIGHSMGGMVMFGYLETREQERIAGFIPVGSMMIMPDPLTPTLAKIARQERLLKASLVINTSMASQLSNYTGGSVGSPVEKALLERANMDKKVLFRFLRTGVDDTSPAVVGQFSNSIREGGFQSKDGSYSYAGNLSEVRVPILFLVGSKDGFATEWMIRANYSAVSSEDKSMRVFSTANGDSTDYGHCDLLMGVTSKKDVYPEILGWLDVRSVPAPAPAAVEPGEGEAILPGAGTPAEGKPAGKRNSNPKAASRE